jgi:hypothetical protein
VLVSRFRGGLIEAGVKSAYIKSLNDDNKETVLWFRLGSSHGSTALAQSRGGNTTILIILNIVYSLIRSPVHRQILPLGSESHFVG